MLDFNFDLDQIEPTVSKLLEWIRDAAAVISIGKTIQNWIKKPKRKQAELDTKQTETPEIEQPCEKPL